MGPFRTTALTRKRPRGLGFAGLQFFALSFLFVCANPVGVAAAVRVELGAAVARPGESTQLTAVLVADEGEEVAAVQLDLTFDSDDIAIGSGEDGRPDCEAEPSIDKGASGFGYRPGDCQTARGGCSRLHAVIVATDNVDAIADGSILYRCRVRVPFNTAAGRYVIHGRRAVYARPDGRERPAAVVDATITVTGAPLDTPTPLLTPTPPHTATPAGSGSGGGGGCALGPPAGSSARAQLLWLLLPFLAAVRHRRTLAAALCLLLSSGLSPAGATVSIDVGNAAGIPGGSVMLEVRLTADAGEEVAGTQNDLRYDPAVAAVVALAEGAPDCAVNPAINKLASAFGFRPTGCDPSRHECTAVRALVLAFDNVDPIAHGSVLYTCRLLIAADASPGRYDLTNTRSGYAPPAGGDRVATARSGALVVDAAPTVTPAPTATIPPATPGIAGDANCDGRIDDDDSLAVITVIFTGTEVCNPDCNGDGAVNGPDLVCIARHRMAALRSSRGVPSRSLRSYGGARGAHRGGK